jgi:signal transduction histidine kinase
VNRHCRGVPRQILPLAAWAGNARVRRTEYSGSLTSEGSSSFDGSAEVVETDALRLLAAGLAHDINNMLHVSVGAIELLQNRIDRRRMEEVSDLSEIALMSLKRASAMTHEFLSFSQPMQIELQRICVSATLASMAELLKFTLGEKIEIKLTLAEGLSQIVCSRQRLESAVLNLAINARDAMPFGGTLAITTFHIDTDETYPDPAHQKGVGIRVADTGEGMSPDTLQRAFDPFYTTKSHGTGLGLTMIKSLVERFRGNVCATSIIGHGTTMELHFPAADSRSASYG